MKAVKHYLTRSKQYSPVLAHFDERVEEKDQKNMIVFSIRL